MKNNPYKCSIIKHAQPAPLLPIRCGKPAKYIYYYQDPDATKRVQGIGTTLCGRHARRLRKSPYLKALGGLNYDK